MDEVTKLTKAIDSLPDGREKLDLILKRTRIELDGRDVFKSKHAELRAKWRSEGLEIHEHCATCGKKLKPHLRKWCSGECMRDDLKYAVNSA